MVGTADEGDVEGAKKKKKEQVAEAMCWRVAEEGANVMTFFRVFHQLRRRRRRCRSIDRSVVRSVERLSRPCWFELKGGKGGTGGDGGEGARKK